MNRVEIYTKLLKRLLPPGRAWIANSGGTLSGLLEGLAEELARAHDRGLRLIEEMDPRTTFELLEDWERICGLPDSCTGLGTTLQDRRNQVVARLLLGGPQNKQFFVDLATSLGYSVSVDDIEEYNEFRAGSRVGGHLYASGWKYAFSITAALHTTRPFRIGQNNAGDRLVEFGDDVLECVLNDHKQAHSIIIFKYA